MNLLVHDILIAAFKETEKLPPSISEAAGNIILAANWHICSPIRTEHFGLDGISTVEKLGVFKSNL